MPSDAQFAKRDKYLIEGRIAVQEHTLEPPSAVVLAKGSDEQPYEVRFRANVWSCSCPAQKPECVHVMAAMLISPLRSQEGVSGIESDADIDALLSEPVGTTVDEDAYLYADDPIPDLDPGLI